MENQETKVLIVEDEGILAKYIASCLANLGYEVAGHASTGLDALNLMQQRSVDLILMDIHIKGELDGINTAERIRLIRDIPIVYMTAHSDDQTIARAKLTEPQGYLVKPFNDSDLKRVVEMALYKHSTEKKIRESEKWLNAILMNLGEGVIAADEKNRVTFLNRVGEKITDWNQKDAIGQDIDQVFDVTIHGLKKQSVRMIQQNGDIHARSTPAIITSKDKIEKPIELVLTDTADEATSRFVIIFRDISERLKAEVERKRIAELERSNRELEHFAFIASHDLQEPLRTITSYTQLMQERWREKFGTAPVKEMDFIVSAALKMHQLIADVLAYSRIDVVSSEFVEVDCGQVLAEVKNNLKASIEASKAVIEVKSLPKIRSNRSILMQLFQNLIGNAIKFRGSQPPKIVVEVVSEEDKWKFSVKDNGIGMEESSTQKIFGMFKRLHSADKYPGTGIGLSLCKKIVELHGGKIWVTSQEGQGSTFYFTLPKIY